MALENRAETPSAESGKLRNNDSRIQFDKSESESSGWISNKVWGYLWQHLLKDSFWSIKERKRIKNTCKLFAKVIGRTDLEFRHK